MLLALGLLLVATGGGCVSADTREGARIEVTLEATSEGLSSEALPAELRLVFDHVELLACEPAPPPGMQAGALRALRQVGALLSASGVAHAAHLPPAPQRLLVADVWSMREYGEDAAAWHAGTLRPPLREWCGVRFGFYSALPGTAAVAAGFPEGRSLLASWVAPEERQVSGSLGFDIEVRGAEEAPWLPAERLSEGALHLRLEVGMEPLATLLEDEGAAADAFAIAAALLEGARVFVEDDAPAWVGTKGAGERP